mmetsp:Transcript_8630/g.15827  ORF Transcript_8630/g.15827 Transcript_8630/m.15827 type:complete len:578 (-) Transcript_8630:130-1863(-)
MGDSEEVGRGVDVVNVGTPLILHSFVATRNVAESEDNARPEDKEGEGDEVDGIAKRRSSLSRLMHRMNVKRSEHPVSPHFRKVLQELMQLLRPTEICRLVVALNTVSVTHQRRKTRPRVKLPLGLGSLLQDSQHEFYVALVSNRLSGEEEDALFVLQVLKQPRNAVRKERSFRRARSVTFIEHDVVNSSFKSDGSIDSSRFQRKLDTGIELSVLRILPIWMDLRIALKGMGLIRLTTAGESLRMGTVSILSMWRLVTSLVRAKQLARRNNYFPRGPSHIWTSVYFEHVASPVLSALNGEENLVETSDSMDRPTSETDETDSDVDSDTATSYSVNSIPANECDGGTLVQQQPDISASSKKDKRLSKASRSRVEIDVTAEIRRIIEAAPNLDDLTTREVLDQLNSRLGKQVMSNFTKGFIDQKIIQIYGQQEPPSLILDWLYLGTEYNAANYAELQKLEIVEVVNVTPPSEIQNFFPEILNYYRIPVQDKVTANLYPYLHSVVTFLEECRTSGKRVLVHCQRGVSRSATVVIAYIMWRQNLSFAKAHAKVKDLRPCIKPNTAFRSQLEKYEEFLLETDD